MPSRIDGILGQERGKRRETAALQRLQAATKWGNRPKWLRYTRAATDEEQRHGVDIVASTDVGLCYLQIKSSKSGAAKHRAKYPHIPVVVMRERTKAAALVTVISQWRASVRAQRTQA